MQIGLAGLGKMGGGMVVRLIADGHDVVGMDMNDDARGAAHDAGARTTESFEELVESLATPRLVWLMLPAGDITRSAIADLSLLLSPGDLVIDGGNSDFRDTPANQATLAGRDVRFVDVGVSGGQWGWKTGYGLMAGCSDEEFEEIAPILNSLSADGQYSRVGLQGSGHLVKAIHNGVQYAILESYAEGFALLKAHDGVDALAALEAWQGGSSVRSYLLEQIVETLRRNPDLTGVKSEVTDSGMGRWTAEEAIRLAIPTPVLSLALHLRFDSRSNQDSNKLLNASRAQIGGQKE